jgi:hypothetical protein
MFCTASSIVTIIYVTLNFEEIFFTSHIELLGLPFEEQIAEQEKGQFASLWAMPGCFLLMNFQFVKSKYIKTIALAAILLGTRTALAYGRRGNGLLLFAFILCIVYIYMMSKEVKTYKKIIVVILIVSGIIYIWDSLDDIIFMEVFIERFDQDTRGDIEKDLADDFGGHILDWIFGRGIGGTYYTSTVGRRDQMETAYFRMILHGGILLLIFYLAVASRAFYLGFFKSNNILSKAMALYIALFIVFLFTSFSPFEFSIKIIIFWLCIIFCYSRTWRMKTNIEIWVGKSTKQAEEILN